MNLVRVWGDIGVAARIGLEVGAEDAAPRMADHARAEAPWTDQTGRARAGLHGFVLADDRVVLAAVSYDRSLPYVEALETSAGGKWGIIARTQEVWSALAGSVFATRVNEALRTLVGRG